MRLCVGRAKVLRYIAMFLTWVDSGFLFVLFLLFVAWRLDFSGILASGNLLVRYLFICTYIFLDKIQI